MPNTSEASTYCPLHSASAILHFSLHLQGSPPPYPGLALLPRPQILLKVASRLSHLTEIWPSCPPLSLGSQMNDPSHTWVPPTSPSVSAQLQPEADSSLPPSLLSCLIVHSWRYHPLPDRMSPTTGLFDPVLAPAALQHKGRDVLQAWPPTSSSWHRWPPR